jgi:hypothetical protein
MITICSGVAEDNSGLIWFGTAMGLVTHGIYGNTALQMD